MAIEVFGARVHNLKNIDVTIPGHSLSVVTGLSGSGKSSLAFDTIYAEGQRRYIETFSSYARNFLGNLERPDVDKISGLSPVISIEQKTVNHNPRSTVGTTTEIYDFLRLLFARAGEAYSYLSGERMVRFSEDQIIDLILKDYEGRRVFLLSPLVRNRKGHYRELFENLRKKGFLNVRIDGEMREILHGLQLDRYKNHSIELVVDKLRVESIDEHRLRQSVRLAMRQGDGMMMIMCDENIKYYSRTLMDPVTGLSYKDPAPHDFSFNSPMGACPHCHGLGTVTMVDRSKIIPDTSLSIADGGIVPLGKKKKSMIFWQIEALLETYDCTLDDPISSLPEEAIEAVLSGTGQSYHVSEETVGYSMMTMPYEGLVKYLKDAAGDDASAKERRWAESFSTVQACPCCHGQRLNQESLHYFIDGKNISQVSALTITDLAKWIEMLPQKLNERQKSIAGEIIKEISSRIKFLIGVGLGYLSLDRPSMSLSGGESQRIRLATQIGSGLQGVLYVLDEPSIGLHQRDNDKLIATLKHLRDLKNTVLVVEHDEDTMLNSDYIIDIGPKAGTLGGEVVACGTPEEVMKNENSITGQYLCGKKQIEVPKKRRKAKAGKELVVRGARENNLKNIDVHIPLGVMTVVSGVSGSGKSTLVNEILANDLLARYHHAQTVPGAHDGIDGTEHLDKCIVIDQSPIGRTPRSNPATYTGVFNQIRELFAQQPEAEIRGYKAGRFSFNIKGGRCEHCQGDGVNKIEMHFLPDVYVTCPACHGRRYNREALEIKYKGKDISQILDMTIDEAVEFFKNIPSIAPKLKTIQEVGLGYIRLGQPATTFSGGEAQRIKLATELARRSTGKTLYILDEPTTGLHTDDVRRLLQILNRLVDGGNSMIIIEHNLHVIKSADWIIDMGPEGGQKGGQIVAEGTPEDLAKRTDTPTGTFLKNLLK